MVKSQYQPMVPASAGLNTSTARVDPQSLLCYGARFGLRSMSRNGKYLSLPSSSSRNKNGTTSVAQAPECRGVHPFNEGCASEWRVQMFA